MNSSSVLSRWILCGSIVILSGAVAVGSGAIPIPYSINTHQGITRAAILRSTRWEPFLAATKLDDRVFDLPYDREYLDEAKSLEKKKNITFLGDGPADFVEAGSIMEDRGSAFTQSGRFYRHFANSQRNFRGLRLWGGAPFFRNLSAIEWGFNEGGADQEDKKNLQDWKSLQEYFFQAFSAPSDLERRRAEADMFYSLGHGTHLLQDMFQPGHSREDAHPFKRTLEFWAQEHARPGGPLGLAVSGAYGTSTLIGSTPVDPKPTFNAFLRDAGLYSGTRFFSDDTYTSLPLPGPSDVVITEEDIITVEQFGELPEQFFMDVVRGSSSSYLASDPVLGYLFRYDDRPATSISLGVPLGLIGGDKDTMADHARNLLPKAVAQSAGLIDHFLRGQIDFYGTNIIENQTWAAGGSGFSLAPPAKWAISYVSVDKGCHPIPGVGVATATGTLWPGGWLPITGSINEGMNQASDPSNGGAALGPELEMFVVYSGRIGADPGVAVARRNVQLSGAFLLPAAPDNEVEGIASGSFGLDPAGAVPYWTIGSAELFITMESFGEPVPSLPGVCGDTPFSSSVPVEVEISINGNVVASTSFDGPTFIPYIPVPIAGLPANGGWTLEVEVIQGPDAAFCPDFKVVIDDATLYVRS